MAKIKLLVEGGKMTPGPAVAQQLGPMGINMGKVISDVNEATSSFKGISVPVVLDIDATTKEYKITVMSPPTSELLKKELGIEKATGERMKIKSGDLAFERVIFVAQQKHENMLSNTFPATVKSVLGTCQAMGILVDNKEINEIMEDFKEGKYDAMIEAKKIEVDEEKAEEIKTFWMDIEEKQKAIIKAAEEAAKENK
jgi:large subunit ribosomal protein L11